MFILIPSDLDWPQNMAQNRKHNDDKTKSKFEKDSIEYGKFSNYENDGVSGEFDGLTYPHSQEMLKVFKTFGTFFYSLGKYNAII